MDSYNSNFVTSVKRMKLPQFEKKLGLNTNTAVPNQILGTIDITMKGAFDILWYVSSQQLGKGSLISKSN